MTEISVTVRHGPPYVLYGDDLGEAKIQGVVVDKVLILTEGRAGIEYKLRYSTVWGMEK